VQLNQRRRLGAEGSFFRRFGLQERAKQSPFRQKLASYQLNIDRSITNMQDLADDFSGDYKEMKMRIGTSLAITFMQGPSFVS
jgi:hypothetical protein